MALILLVFSVSFAFGAEAGVVVEVDAGGAEHDVAVVASYSIRQRHGMESSSNTVFLQQLLSLCQRFIIGSDVTNAEINHRIPRPS
jgi:hypothetical protein